MSVILTAFQALGMSSREFQKALEEDNLQEQEVALRSMSDAIEKALATVMEAQSFNNTLH
jgi:hypothetical protein